MTEKKSPKVKGKPMGRPVLPGRVLRLRLSDVVLERLDAQAALFGMSTGVYASYLVAQSTLAAAQSQTALEGALRSVAQGALDGMARDEGGDA